MTDVNEPPAKVTTGGIELQPRKTGHRFLDLTVAGSAILISCISLFIAIQQARTMQKQVAAASWPLLQFESSNIGDLDGKPSISMEIRNAGVGPAVVRNFTVYYGAKAYTNPYQLAYDCCGYLVADPDPTKPAPGHPVSRPIESTVIRSGDAAKFFSLDYAPGNEDAWHKLDAARFKLRFDVCYCSVLDECWKSNLVGIEPSPVKSCPPAHRSERGN